MDNERNAALDAVFDLVATRGAGETTPRRVAERSGIDGSTLRRRYGSRFGLLMTAAKELELRRDRLLAAIGATRPATVAQRRDHLEAVVRALLLDSGDRRELLVHTELVASARRIDGMATETAGMGTRDRATLAAALARAEVGDIELETERLAVLISGLAFETVYPHGAPPDSATRVLRHHIASIVR